MQFITRSTQFITRSTQFITRSSQFITRSTHYFIRLYDMFTEYLSYGTSLRVYKGHPFRFRVTNLKIFTDCNRYI